MFGSLSAAGQRLNNLTGIAAILRYEMTALQDMVDDEDEGDIDSEEDEGEIGGSQAGETNSDANSTGGNKSAQGGSQRAGASAATSSVRGSIAPTESAAGATLTVTSHMRSTQRPNECDSEEAKSFGIGGDDSDGEGNFGGWDNAYLEEVFGAVEDIDYDDEVALEHLGE